jgi:thiamine-monophosphate kinase
MQHRRTSHPRTVVDVGDDAAAIAPASGRHQLFTCDTMVETIHFLPRTMSPWDIGWKCMAANVSDIAAMGGEPTFALVSIAASREGYGSDDALDELVRGLMTCAEQWGVHVIGGDTVRSPKHLTITVSLLGEVEAGRALTRSNARPGDVVFVTGSLGDAAAGLHYLLHTSPEARNASYPSLLKRHQQPVPQVAAGRWMAASGLRVACNDVSDGLAQEAWEIAEASKVCMVLEAESMPYSDEVLAYAQELGVDPADWALFGGEDFQLLGTTDPAAFERLSRDMAKEGLSLIPIGWVESGPAEVVWLKQGKREKMRQRGYNHFADG